MRTIKQPRLLLVKELGLPRSLHWDVKLHYVHELQKNMHIFVQHIDTELQIADILTKPLPEEQHLLLAAYLMGSPLVFD